MESIEKLRKMDDGMLVPLGNGQYVPDHSHNAIADEIEQEIAEKYMELPVDADGVPIKVGDEVMATFGGRCKEFDNGPHKVFAVSSDALYLGTIHRYIDSQRCRHIKPRTLEGVLNELVEAVRYERVCDKLLSETSIADFAAEIRELMGVGE